MQGHHGIFLYNNIFTKRSWLQSVWSLLAPAKFTKMMQRCDESIIHLSNVVEGVRVRSCMDTGQLGGGKVTCFKVISVVNNHTFTHSLCTRRPKTTFTRQFCLHETHLQLWKSTSKASALKKTSHWVVQNMYLYMYVIINIAKS